MDALKKSVCLPSTPKKRAPRKEKSQVWSEAPSKLSHIPGDLQDLWQAVKQLQERLESLDQEWQDLLDHLSEQEDGDPIDTDEEDHTQN